MFGERVKRVEDPALLRGRGRFVDDIHLPEMLHAAFVRSAHAHARIRAVDASAAAARPDVAAVYALDDLRPFLADPVMPLEQPSGALLLSASPPVLADRVVRYVGEPVACVVADSAYAAEDAAASVAVECEELPASADFRRALDDGAPRAHAEFAHNEVAAFSLGYGDVEAAFAGAARVFREELHQRKGLGHAMECRGVAARLDERDGVLTVWSGTQMAHRARDLIARILDLPEDGVRVIAPHVGGGFGPKFVFYQEEAVVPLAAKLLRRPVKWTEDRREHFTAATMERDQLWSLEAAVDADGRLRGVRGNVLHDHGAYTPYGINLPYNAATNFLGPYELPALALDVSLALTNMTPVTPVRGAGRPQGTFAMERLMDRIASELGLDRAEVRRRNMITPDRMPYETPVRTRDGSAMTYDSGDYPAAMERALAEAGYGDFAARQRAARAEGRHVGIGVANYVEGTGRGPFESAVVRIGPSGRVAVATGATDQGQGLATALAQVCAARLGVGLRDVDVACGDTGPVSLGLGAFASRQAVTAGSSVHVAAGEVREKALRVAAHLLEVAEDDLEIADGRISVRGVAGMSVGLGDVARAVQGMPGFSLPGGVEPGMEATAHFSPENLTYCNGAHVAEVEVDPGTGRVSVLGYVIVHDSGRLINPAIVDGQVAGGAVHGLGCTLLERMVYDGRGQPRTTNFGDYLLPAAPETPRLDIVHMESPTPLNPLGVKGAGEGGVIPVAAAVASAVEHALAPWNVVVDELPVRPERVVEMLRSAGGAH